MEFSEGWQSIDAGFRDLNSWLDSELYNINNQTATALDFFKWSEMLNLEGIRAVRYSEIRDTAESVQERRTSIVEQIFIKNPEALNLKLALGMGHDCLEEHVLVGSLFLQLLCIHYSIYDVFHEEDRNLTHKTFLQYRRPPSAERR